jgi:DNA polymerase I-like protein with 3'-5' exonuclease and polymerase domains
LFEDLSPAKYISFDVETYDPLLKEKGPGTFRGDGWIAGIAIKPNDGPGSYYPIGHTSNNIPINKVKQYLQDQLGTDKPKVGAKVLYDLEWLRWLGVKVRGRKYDVQIAEPLIDENRFQYNLEDISQRHLGQGKLYDDLVQLAQRIDPKIKAKKDVFKVLYKMDPLQMQQYPIMDVDLPLQIFDKQLPILQSEELMDVFLLETDLTDLMLEMRFNGVRVDVDQAQQVRSQLVAQEKKLAKELKYIAGQDVEIWAAENIAVAFDRAGIQYPRTPKTKKPSFTAPWLEAHPSPLAQKIVELRKVTKMRSDFIDSMVLGSAINGRIHPQFHQVKHDEGGTVSGRFSSSNPNLQQVPSRDEIYGPMIRGLFIPEDGCMWCKGDYAQQEPRVTVHYASLLNLPGAAEAVKRYRDNPDTDYHQMVADMCGIERRPAKNINLGLAYGMGIEKMASQLGKTVDETKALFKMYHAGVPFVQLLSNRCMNTAITRGYIKTLLGRRRHFNLYLPPRYDKENPVRPLPYDEAVKEYGIPVKRAFTHKALNSLIQGTSADMVKKAMLDMYKEGIVPHITVHDETDTSVETEAQAYKIKQIMEDTMVLEVPIKADLFIEKNWGACH